MKKLIFTTFLLTVILALRLTVHDTAKAQAPIGNYLELFGGRLKTILPADNTPSGFTFEAWVKPETLAGVQSILSIGDSAGGKFRYEVGINGGSLFLNYRYNTNSTHYIASGQMNEGVWNHLAVSISNTATKLFINGTDIFPTGGENNLSPIGDKVVLGDSFLEPLVSTKIFKGKIDEVRISNTARNIASLWEIGTYNSPLSADSNTVILWHLDEARGVTQAQDSSGNNYSGALIGGDSLIHFYGVLPTPTPFSGFVLPTIRWNRPILPTLSLPGWNSPTSAPPPTIALPTSSIIDVRSFPRPTRSLFR